MSTILHLDSSARSQGSITRQLTKRMVAHLDAGGAKVIRRDLALEAPEFVTEEWIEASYTVPEDRTEAQRAVLSTSDRLIAELIEADTIVIGVPVYNYGVPASLKAWMDLIARVGVTFGFGPDGAVGLLTGKRAYVAYASGGTTIGSTIDFASEFVEYFLGFIGVPVIDSVSAENPMQDEATALSKANAQIHRIEVPQPAFVPCS